jgi:1,4-alpha-glucan branching enzyme
MYAMVEYLSGEPLDLEKIKNAIDPTRLGFATATSVTNYLANHDQNRLFRKLGEKGLLDEELFRRAKLGALILMTAVGVPMIWMGEEFGEHVPMSEASNKINWTLLENDENKALFNYYKTLIGLRTTNAAFGSTNIEFFHEDSDSGVLCFHRFDDNGTSIVVVLNLSDDDLENYSIPRFPLDGDCHEWTKGDDLEISANELTLNLARREGLVLTISTS